MHYIASNIKTIRKNEGLTQQAFADAMGVKRSLIGAYEEGRAEPRISFLQHMSLTFNIHLNDLINNDLSDGKSAMQADIEGSKLRILPISVDRESGEERAVMVPVKAAAGYLNGLTDADFIQGLPTFAMPFSELKNRGTIRLFQINGDSMLPVPSGAYIICEYIQNWQEIQHDKCHVVISRDEGIVYKRLVNDLPNQRLLLKSDNPEYEPYYLHVSQVLEVWKAVGYTVFDTDTIKGSGTDLSRVLSELQSLRAEVSQIKANA